MNVNYETIKKAVGLVHEGATQRVDIDKNTKVYAVGENVIRIDLKK